MKKIIFLFLLGLFSNRALIAQVRVGFKGGINFANMRYLPRDGMQGNPNPNTIVSYHIGPILDVHVNPLFVIQTGALISSKGSRLQFNNSYGNYTNTIRPVYLEIPANLLFEPNITYGTTLYLGLGPYIGFGIGGKSKYGGRNTQAGDFYTDHKLTFGNDPHADLKKNDFGGNLLAGINFNNGMILGTQYGISFANNTSKRNSNAARLIRNKVFSVSIGYLFSNY